MITAVFHCSVCRIKFSLMCWWCEFYLIRQNFRDLSDPGSHQACQQSTGSSHFTSQGPSAQVSIGPSCSLCWSQKGVGLSASWGTVTSCRSMGFLQGLLTWWLSCPLRPRARPHNSWMRQVGRSLQRLGMGRENAWGFAPGDRLCCGEEGVLNKAPRAYCAR